MATTAEELEEYRRRLVQAFPPCPYEGRVSAHSDCDDGVLLLRELCGRRWDELTPEVLFHGSIALPLLESDAVEAFLPAWLLHGMQTFGTHSPALEFTLYFLCPGEEDEGWDEERTTERAGLFTTAQRILIADLLRRILAEPAMWFWHARAKAGLTWWDVG